MYKRGGVFGKSALRLPVMHVYQQKFVTAID